MLGTIPSKFRLSAIAAGCTLILPLLSSSVWADDAQDTDQTSGSGQRVEGITVTGSHIRRTSKETPSPVQTISADDLKASGYTSLSDVLHDVTANNMGSLTQANPGAFAAGGSGISLRGLTVGATLVLIDGHRMASYPMPDDGERDFVDISSIPFDIIERIEVLKDGASAVYGSDAMAGVVNVILKKSFQGTTINAEDGVSSRHDGQTPHVSITTGWGNLAEDGQNAYVSLEYRHQDSVLLTSRPSIANADWTKFGGVNFNTSAYANLAPVWDSTSLSSNPVSLGNGSCPACAANAYNSHYTIQPETENLNFFGRFNKKLAEDWQLSLEASVFNSEAKQQGVYNQVGTTNFGINSFNFQPGSPISQVNSNYIFTLPINSPLYTQTAGQYGQGFDYNFPDVGPQTQKSSTTSYRFVAELNGSFNNWDIESSIGATRVSTKLDNSNYLNIQNMQNALNDLSYIPGAINPGAVLSYVAPSASSTSTNDLDFFSLHGTHSLAELEGGELSIGTGFDFVHRSLNEQFPNAFATGQQYSPIYSFAVGTQNISAGFVEMVAPITKQFEVDAAARIDHYDTYGSSTTPKVGFKFTPSDSLLFRGTYAEGFRAPNPAEMGNSGSTSGVLQNIYDPVLCKGGVASTAIDQTQCNITSPPEEQLSNPHLKPEKSKSYTLGVLLEPTNWFNVSVDYYDIKLSNQIISVGLLGQNEWNNPSAYGAVIYRGAPINGDPVGPLSFETYPFINASSTVTSGFDIDNRMKFNLGKYGKLVSDLSLTHMIKYDMSFGGATYSLAGTHGPSFISGDTGAPKDRAQETLTWTYGAYEVAGTLNYVSGYSVLDPSAGINDCATALQAEFGGATPPSQFCNVSSFTEFNLQGKYTVNKHLSFHGSVTNLFDRHAPLDLQTFGAAGNGAPSGGAAYNPALAQDGAIGRFFNVGLTYAF